MADLPPFLEDQLEEVIRQRMLERMPADLDKTEGSIPWDAISPV
ncbi:baseplate J family protein, partial [Paenibacillus dendritiformis]